MCATVGVKMEMAKRMFARTFLILYFIQLRSSTSWPKLGKKKQRRRHFGPFIISEVPASTSASAGRTRGVPARDAQEDAVALQLRQTVSPPTTTIAHATSSSRAVKTQPTMSTSLTTTLGNKTPTTTTKPQKVEPIIGLLPFSAVREIAVKAHQPSVVIEQQRQPTTMIDIAIESPTTSSSRASLYSADEKDDDCDDNENVKQPLLSRKRRPKSTKARVIEEKCIKKEVASLGQQQLPDRITIATAVSQPRPIVSVAAKLSHVDVVGPITPPDLTVAPEASTSISVPENTAVANALASPLAVNTRPLFASPTPPNKWLPRWMMPANVVTAVTTGVRKTSTAVVPTVITRRPAVPVFHNSTKAESLPLAAGGVPFASTSNPTASTRSRRGRIDSLAAGSVVVSYRRRRGGTNHFQPPSAEEDAEHRISGDSLSPSAELGAEEFSSSATTGSAADAVDLPAVFSPTATATGTYQRFFTVPASSSSSGTGKKSSQRSDYQLRFYDLPQHSAYPPPFFLPPPLPLHREHSPTLISTSRKWNKSSRMSQGPQRYHSFADILLDFCARTSSHGVPFIGTHSFFGRCIWSVITVLAFSAFIIQTYYTLYDYLQYRTIIEMQLKFEPAPFPAATLCNLNSFKFSELRKFEEIEQGFAMWERAISTLDQISKRKAATATSGALVLSNGQLRHVGDDADEEGGSEKEKANGGGGGRRFRRGVKSYRPVYVKCVCNLPHDDQCVPQRNDLDVDALICICFEDARTGDIWPCYARSAWTEKTCYHCSNSNTCDDPDRPPNITTFLTERRATDCMCQSVSHYCLVKRRDEDIRWWNPYNYSVYPATEPPTPSSEVQEAFGLENLHDRGAITTRTKENLIFLVAQMPRETRRQLSYTLDEFVLRCSFNSKDCDLERDFQTQIDPEYGNCFTFNFNDSVELKNSRAGPMYGLRLLLNVNQSDYMPTTEAAGVRLVVHEQDQEPFPDTFGYSAPTGFVSSFGLKTKVLHRLDAPYGKCSDTFRPANYIYAEHYSPEVSAFGCYRNCFQQIILERCGCGDPRFPLPSDDDRPCDARSAAERACLANQTSVLGGFHHLTHDCHCVQPCTENVFETAYSAAAWPAENFKIGDDCSSVLEKENFTQAECIEYYRQNTAYIEIYYEQLNFESLKETAGYTMVNLFSDLGGNIGLWIGFSLITVLEFIEFFCECIAFALRTCVVRGIKRKGHLQRGSGDGGAEERGGGNGWDTDELGYDDREGGGAAAWAAYYYGYAGGGVGGGTIGPGITVNPGDEDASAATTAAEGGDDPNADDRRRLTAGEQPSRRRLSSAAEASAIFHHPQHHHPPPPPPHNHYFDPRRNSALNRQWRRYFWQQQQLLYRQQQKERQQHEQRYNKEHQQRSISRDSSTRSKHSSAASESAQPPAASRLARAMFGTLGLPDVVTKRHSTATTASSEETETVAAAALCNLIELDASTVAETISAPPALDKSAAAAPKRTDLTIMRSATVTATTPPPKPPVGASRTLRFSLKSDDSGDKQD